MPDGPRLRRPGPPQLPVRPALPGALDRPLGAARRAGRARLHAPAGRLHDPDGAGRAAARAGEHPPEPAPDPIDAGRRRCASWPRRSAGLRRWPSSWSGPGSSRTTFTAVVSAGRGCASRRASRHPSTIRTRPGSRRDCGGSPTSPTRSRSAASWRCSIPAIDAASRDPALDALDERRLLMLDLGLWTQDGLPASPRRASDGSTPTRRSATSSASCSPTGSVHRLGGPRSELCRSPAR